jgi:hypothetical protein
MKEIINLILLIVLGILYLTSYTKIQIRYFNNIYTARNNAITIIYLASVFSSGLILLDISKVMSDAFSFYYSSHNLTNGILFIGLYFILAWGVSFGLFHTSFKMVSLLTKEKEKEELKNNNVELALIHACILIILSLIIASPLSQFCASLIEYPELPF